MAASGEADADTLAALRATIDRLDAEMHHRLIERSSAIGALIKAKGIVRPGAAFRPAREADMLRRLVARHEGALPIATVEHIWREIIATFTRVQAGYDVAFDASVDAEALRDVARFLFGFSVTLTARGGPAATIAHIRESGTDLGVIGLAQPEEAGAWWRALGRPGGPRAMALHPFIKIPGRPVDVPALIVSPDLTDATPLEIALFAATAHHDGVPDETIAAAGGTVLARAARELLVAIPAGTRLSAVAARAGLDDVAPVGGVARGVALGVAADPLLYETLVPGARP
ncbi:chorismate mutase [Prosthecomicrobium pneumaticum]|uniref:chorismate mutase n=1 Tax=Prosthecomicrobium pneumaticum TaxID=81895 RepID=A0A7W9FQJ0_9HYPH|nr:chorismate mutase [Prosthecomicrobium pneumaticum]MBB5754953.1 chorismate mutase [Prosthecomicrobium pneumaticum]